MINNGLRGKTCGPFFGGDIWIPAFAGMTPVAESGVNQKVKIDQL
jgi:hypothetical protein